MKDYSIYRIMKRWLDSQLLFMWFLWICSVKILSDIFAGFSLQAFITWYINPNTYNQHICREHTSELSPKKKIPSSWEYVRNSNSRKFGFNSQRTHARFSLPQLSEDRHLKIILICSANVWRCPIHLHGRDSPGKPNLYFNIIDYERNLV